MRLIYVLRRLRHNHDMMERYDAAMFDGIRICSRERERRAHLPTFQQLFISFFLTVPLSYSRFCIPSRAVSITNDIQNLLSRSLQPSILSLSSLLFFALTDFLGAVDLMRETKSGGKAEVRLSRPRGIFWRGCGEFQRSFFPHSSQPEKGLKT